MATGTYYAVRLGPDKNPSKGEIIHHAPKTGDGIPQEIMDLWVPGQVAVVWGYDTPLRQLSEQGLASVRQKRLRRRLEDKIPLLADVIEEQEHAAKPEFFAGKREHVTHSRSSFDELRTYHKDRMDELRDTFNAQGYLLARSERDPEYAILLTRMGKDFNVHSFRGDEPVGHRDYDRLDGGGPTQNALQEFVGRDMKLETR